MNKPADFAFEIRPPTDEEGGGLLVSYPHFVERISDGETVEEALVRGSDTLKVTSPLLAMVT